MLLITPSSRRPLDRTVCASSCCWRSSGVPTSSSARPITPLIGVRISWLMLARNSPLARVARSARAVASASAAVRSRTRASRLASVSPSAACAATRSATACRRWLSRSRRRATIASRSRCSACTSIAARAATGLGEASRPHELISCVSATSCSIGQVTRRAARRANGHGDDQAAQHPGGGDSVEAGHRPVDARGRAADEHAPAVGRHLVAGGEIAAAAVGLGAGHDVLAGPRAERRLHPRRAADMGEDPGAPTPAAPITMPRLSVTMSVVPRGSTRSPAIAADASEVQRPLDDPVARAPAASRSAR